MAQNATMDMQKESNPGYVSSSLRREVLQYSKDFKTSWIKLGQHLFSIYRDHHYEGWGYDKFEQYTEQELGITKALSLKLLKTYIFIEEEEPAYLKKDYSESREPIQVPGYEEVNALRLARGKKDLQRQDFGMLKKSVFEKGKSAGAIRKDLTAMMRERKQVDPEEERDLRNEASIRKLVSALKMFNRDMESLKLISPNIIGESKLLMERLEKQLP